MVNSEWQLELIERHGRSEARWVDAALALASLTSDMDGHASGPQIEEMAANGNMARPCFEAEVANAQSFGWLLNFGWDQPGEVARWRLAIPPKN